MESGKFDEMVQEYLEYHRDASNADRGSIIFDYQEGLLVLLETIYGLSREK